VRQEQRPLAGSDDGLDLGREGAGVVGDGSGGVGARDACVPALGPQPLQGRMEVLRDPGAEQAAHQHDDALALKRRIMRRLVALPPQEMEAPRGCVVRIFFTHMHSDPSPADRRTRYDRQNLLVLAAQLLAWWALIEALHAGLPPLAQAGLLLLFCW
jgi:hypothetical protein